MRVSKISFFICLLAFSLSLIALSQKDVQTRIREIEALIDDTLSPWKIRKEDVVGGAEITLEDTRWSSANVGFYVRDKLFWLRHTFQVPESFAGVKTEGSEVSLSFLFRGLGHYEGQFFVNGEFQKAFKLEFGNQTGQMRKEFLLPSKAEQGEKILLAFRFDNLGRLPLLEHKTAEEGTFFQLQEACFQIRKALKAHQSLSHFLLDLKTGAGLLDFFSPIRRPPRGERPVAEAYRKLISSREFQNMKQRFKKALMDFDLEALRQGNFPKVQSSLSQFYKESKEISRLSRNYTVCVSGNSHIDLAWLWRWPETVEVAKETFSTIMDNMEEYPGVVYVQSQAQAYKWVEEYYPEIFERIRQKVKQGRWEIVGGMWAEPDCNLIDGESFIRQILYGKRYFKEKFGVDVQIGWNPDSFGYNWNMPQFFKKSGIDAFITQKISWNDTTVFPYFLFWWKGPDGSKILTYFPPTGYVGRLRAEQMIDGLKQFEKNTGFKEVLILYGLGNHGGGPNREMLDRVEGYREQKIFPKVNHCTVSQFLNEIKKKNLESLPLLEDELYLEYHRGTYTTQAETKRLNRKSEVFLSNTEKLSSLAYLFGKAYKVRELRKAWKKVLMNQFHDILPGSSITPVYRDAKESYLEVLRILKKIQRESLLYLAQKIDTKRGNTGTPLLVLNPLSWTRDGLVRVALPPELQEGIIVLNESGEEVPSQILMSEQGNRLCFVAREVPSLGYKIYKIQKKRGIGYESSLKVGKTTLENSLFTLNFHPETGNIISIFDKIAKKEILSEEACGNELQLFEDIPDRWDAWNIQYTGRSWKLNTAKSITIGQKGPVMASLKVKKDFLGLSKARRAPTPDFPSSFFSQEIILYEDLPRIDIEMKADWWEDHVLLKVAFPVDVQSRKATYEIPFASIQRPTTRNTDWEKARFEVPAIRWADLSDGKYGVSLLNESKYGYDIKDNVMRLTLLRSPTWPDILADRGKHRFSYALYPHKGDWKEADTVQKGYEFNCPLISLFVESHPGELPPSYSFFKATPSNIILATVKKAEDEKSLILRLYESEGRSTRARLELFGKPKKIFELDLMENRLKNLHFEENSFELNFGKSEIKTVEVVY